MESHPINGCLIFIFMQPQKYLKQLIDPFFQTGRTKEIFTYNPAIQEVRKDAAKVSIEVYNYNFQEIDEYSLMEILETSPFKNDPKITWINIEGISKKQVEQIAAHYGIHNLLVEDILSIGQRPKMDDIDGVLFCLLNMLYFNEQYGSVEQEQVSIAFGENFVITFQEDEHRDVFNSIREKLKLSSSKIRQRGADYLCYSLLDMIVDHYFEVMDKLGERIEKLEEEVIRARSKRPLAQLNALRKEMIVLKRNVAPVRDIINGLIKSESQLLDANNDKYFKDVYDHILQANEVADNYRDMLSNLQDLYISQVNLKMNEVMKVMAVVTCLLAPGTVIGGIFGMNFDVIPTAHQYWGFYVAVGLMLAIPIIMLIIFKRRGWF